LNVYTPATWEGAAYIFALVLMSLKVLLEGRISILYPVLICEGIHVFLYDFKYYGVWINIFTAVKQFSVNWILFVRHLLLCILCVGQSQILDPNEIFIHLRNILLNLKSTNSSVNKHVHCRQTTKCCAHEIKWFYSYNFMGASLQAYAWSSGFSWQITLCFTINYIEK